MVNSEDSYPVQHRRMLGLWEWHLLMYWNTLLRDFSTLPHAHLELLEASLRRPGFSTVWEFPAFEERFKWRWRFLFAKLGVGKEFYVHELPDWLRALVTVRFLDEPLNYFGRPLLSYPARSSEYRFA